METIKKEDFLKLHAPNNFAPRHALEDAYKLGMNDLVGIIQHCYPNGILIGKE